MKRKLTMFLALFFIGVGMMMAQVRVLGTIVDENNEPVIGATVLIKGTTSGTITDYNGKFELSAPTNGKLQVSYVGYRAQEVDVAPILNITLQVDSELLEDVVVVGYMQRKITATTASVVKVDSKKIEEKPTANPMDALQGKVSGLQVYTSSGEPAQLSSLKLHGVGSLGAGSSPLYIVDGVPVGTATIRSMNPNDFESMQILKDAAATSIYGARAANGVVYITTKRGTVAERAKVTVRGQYGTSNLANEKYYNQLMNTDQFFDFYQTLGLYSEAQVASLREQYPNDTKWHKYYLRSGVPTYQGDVSISGGSGRTSYYISGGLFSQEGMREGSSYDKLNLRSNINTQLNKIMRFGINTSIAYDKIHVSPYERNSTVGGGLAFLAPPFYTHIDPETGKDYEEVIPGWNRTTPKYHTSKQRSAEKTRFTNLSAHLTVNPLEGLDLRSQVGLEMGDYFYDRYRLASHREAPNNGFGTKDFARRSTLTWTNTAQYSFKIEDDHNISLLAGHEFIDYKYHYIRANASGMQDDRLMLLPSGVNKNVDESKSEYAFLSYFGQASYDFQEKYILDLVLRNDASSRFGKNKRNGMFWSTGVMWKAKKENFLEDVSWLNELDLKFSIGTQGNADIGNYESYALAGQIGQYGEQPGWGLTSPGNDNLGWEKQRKTSVGINSRLFNFMDFNIEYYHRLTSDMLMSVPLPMTSGVPQDGLGFSSVPQNVGKYLNQGIDIHMNFDIIRKREASLEAYFNFNYNKDKVVELFQDRESWILPGYGFGYIVGEPVNFVYPIFKQINSETGMPEWYIPGDNIAEKQEGDVTNYFSETLEQNTGIRRNTPMVGGFGIAGDYKGFYLQADFTFALGKNMISNDRYFFENPIDFAGFNQSTKVFNYWKQPGDNADYASLDYLFNVDSRFFHFDSRMIEDASFMRLKNLSVGYNIPKKYIRGNVFKGAKVYVTGRNVLTFTKYTGGDPEVDSNLSLGDYPNSRQYIVGVELNF